MDLIIVFLNHRIDLDWVDDQGLDYVRQGEFIPCNWKKCLNGHTSKVAHAGQKGVLVKYKCNKRAVTKTVQMCVSILVKATTTAKYATESRMKK